MSTEIRTYSVDLGCGLSNCTVNYQNIPNLIIGIDRDPKVLKQNSSVIDGSLTPIIADIQHLPFIDSCFTMAIVSHSLEHLTNIGSKKSIEETHRVLKPNGVAIVAIPHPNFERIMDKLIVGYHSNRMHQQVITSEKIKVLLEEAGFEVDFIKMRKWFIAIGLILQAISSRFISDIIFDDQTGFSNTNHKGKMKKLGSLWKRFNLILDSVPLLSDMANSILPFETYAQGTKLNP